MSRHLKFEALARLTLGGDGWVECPTEWRAPFLPESGGAWATYPRLEDLFLYNGSGVMPGRTWIIAPDARSLLERWDRLIHAPDQSKEELFHPHMRDGRLGDKHSRRVVPRGLPGYAPRPKPAADDVGPCVPPRAYGFRSFDRQWIIPDNRLINQPNPELWAMDCERQVYLTALTRTSPLSGPALTFTALIPDLDHYKGSFGGRVFPLWGDRGAKKANVPSELLAFLTKRFGRPVGPEELVAYVAAVAAHPAFTARFRDDLTTPGIRIPLTADCDLFEAEAKVGRTIIWLHTFGERFADGTDGRPAGPPRLPANRAPRVPKEGAIPQGPEDMPATIDYDATKGRLCVGRGYVEGVTSQVWSYEVSGKQVVRQWFSYRGKNRERPIIGTRRAPSPLSAIQPDHWLPEYTTELINLLHVLGWLVELEPVQAELLDRICEGPTFSEGELRAAGVIGSASGALRRGAAPLLGQMGMLDA